ncbi:Uncharacterised protein [Yersinia pseudotuberculosis]|uniref:Uncharacterized protein n=1 Tax=Yersinia similis TaxID=367190 RepID=A0A0T9QL83_9GAMM|nr:MULTISPECIES: hypothetical protein [Yersinia pseudotuberculosis complex]CNI16401.1 Uncharacterised protein [Yersinia similis]CNK59172.1 Uncharacterised protein [Yersinia pseudotuberculosis]
MSPELQAVLRKNKQSIYRAEHIRSGSSGGRIAVKHTSAFVRSHGGKVFFFSLLVCALLPIGQVEAEVIKVDGDLATSDIFTLEPFALLHEEKLDRVRNGVEVFSPISPETEAMSRPGTDSKRGSSPDEGDYHSVLFKKSDEGHGGFPVPKLIPSIVLLLVVVGFCLSVGSKSSERLCEKDRRYRKLHKLKAKRFYRKHSDSPGAHYKLPRRTFCQWFWRF